MRPQINWGRIIGSESEVGEASYIIIESKFHTDSSIIFLLKSVIRLNNRNSSPGIC